MDRDSVLFPSTKGSLTSVIWATFRKYGIIFLGYAVSLALFIVTSMFDVLGSFRFLGEFWAFMVNRMVFGAMLFCGFLIMYLIREQKLERLQNKLAEEQKLRDGIRIAENEIRNQIILIHQAAFVLSEKKEYDEEMVQVIRENTLKMDK